MTESDRLKIEVSSEIGKLEAVLLHEPNEEVENMTPRTVQRALYSDILNLSIAKKEYEQLFNVLSLLAEVRTVKGQLLKVLDNPQAREDLIRRICLSEDAMHCYEALMSMSSNKLATVLIEGLPAKIDSLTSFLANEYYALYPLYNFYFTRDASVSIGNRVLICHMANKVRMRESLIMNAIFNNNQQFDCEVIDANDPSITDPKIIMEGGDILVVRDDILVIGNGLRTTSQGIDFIVNRFKALNKSGRYHVLVQQLPHTPESFIHLDMVFTLLDKDKCMAFEPLILGDNQYQTIHIIFEDGVVKSIKSVTNLVKTLARLGVDLEPISCGGDDEWNQEREQWHSGANFFACAPGKVLTYARNLNTLDALSKAGFNIIPANDVIERSKSLTNFQKGDYEALGLNGLFAITIDGSELPRGGGGARCMTMPLNRQKVNW